MNPTRSSEFMNEISRNNNGWALIIDSISRIFVGIGIYQTIQAFRKYGGSKYNNSNHNISLL